MAKKMWSESRQTQLLELYAAKELSACEIADRLGVSHPTIYSHLRQMGKSTDCLPRRHRAPHKLEFSETEKSRIRELAGKGKFVTEIASELGRTRVPTRRIVKELGLEASNFRKTRIGERFGYLTVKEVLAPERTYKGHQESRSLLTCHCGKEVVVYNYNLRSGNTRTCGCKIHLHRKHASYMRILHQYIAGAKMRGLEHQLTVPQTKLLVHRPCFYCGCPPSNTLIGRKKGISTRDQVLLYSGIDRVNSQLGYILGNVLPCCKMCNKAKSDCSIDLFVKWLQRLGRHLTEEHINIAAALMGEELQSANEMPLFF